ncbi:MAG: 50S ribosomal protein L6 [Erysipelotrichaceae bacterium]|nr:50S ribosomal protein L6 [Erysipelotrichaceae bacterium]
MSRIGNKAITIPEDVEVSISDSNEVTVKGPKGTLTRQFSPLMEIKIEDGTIVVIRENEEKQTKQLHGTTRALINNMIEGCHKEFTKELEIVGIGFRANVANNNLNLHIGYSHDIVMPIEEGLTVVCPTATTITVSGIDKQRVGEFAANIRNHRKPEPYKGKGIRYKNEQIRRKEGKTAAAKK